MKKKTKNQNLRIMTQNQLPRPKFSSTLRNQAARKKSTASATSRRIAAVEPERRMIHPDRAHDLHIRHLLAPSTREGSVVSAMTHLHGVSTLTSGSKTISLPAGCRLFLALTCDPEVLAAGFYLPVGNEFFDRSFYPGSDLTVANMSYPMTSNHAFSSGEPITGFQNSSHPYKEEIGSKDIILLTPTGLRPDHLVNGVEEAAEDADNFEPALTTLLQSEIELTATTSLGGQAVFYYGSTDDKELPPATSVLTTGTSVRTSSECIRVRRPVPTSGDSLSILDLMNSSKPYGLGSAQSLVAKQRAHLVGPSMWQGGSSYPSNALTVVGNYFTADSVRSRIAKANPFLGCLMTGQYFIVDAIGEDLRVTLTVRSQHFIEHAPRGDTDQMEAQKSALFLRAHLHSTDTSLEARRAALIPSGVSAIGSTESVADRELREQMTRRIGYSIPVPQIHPAQTVILDPPHETRIEHIVHTALSVLKGIGEGVKTAFEIGKSVRAIVGAL
jgi:hypothetical protein